LGSAVALAAVLFFGNVQQGLHIVHSFSLPYLENVVEVVDTMRGKLVFSQAEAADSTVKVQSLRLEVCCVFEILKELLCTIQRRRLTAVPAPVCTRSFGRKH